MVNPIVSVCANSTVLNSTLEKVRCVITDAGETCRTIVESSLTNCPSGCNSDVFPAVCNPTNFETNLMFLGLAIIIVIIIGAVAKKYG